MLDPWKQQAGFNAASHDQWEAFAPHRARVAEVLAGAADGAGQGRLCVLGAGNCNDLDLARLLANFREILLVDLDTEALRRGVGRQGFEAEAAVRRVGGIDVTGMLDAIAGWPAGAAIPAEMVRSFVERPAERVAPGLFGPFDVVASTCLLRPLMAHAFHAVGDQHPQFVDLVRAIRAGHLRLLRRLAGPGGRVVLITDLVSSVTLPALGGLPEASLPALLPELSRTGNFFHGVDPAELRASFRDDAGWEGGAEGVSTLAPWRWRLHDRLYLVWGLTSGRVA